MKLITKTGNLLHVTTGHIVHGCNAQGVMGSGVALAVKQTYPEVYDDYSHIYRDVGLTLGKAYPVHINDQLTVWNAITQDSYGYGIRQTSYDAVATCFAQINKYINDTVLFDVRHTPAEVHIPLIGAARGGGNWEIIREIIEQTMEHNVTLWLPDHTVTTR